MNASIIRTEQGFSVMLNGKQFPIPIGYMRVSEVQRFEAMINSILDEFWEASILEISNTD